MKAAWVGSPDSNTWPPWQKLKAAGVNRVYYAAIKEARDAAGAKVWVANHQTTNDYRVASLTQISQYGMFRDLHWDGGTPNAQNFISKVSGDIARSGMAHTGPYMIDAEFPYRDPNLLVAIFAGVRHLFPDLLLSWTMEPMQGGWIKGCLQLVNWINHDKNMVVVVQTFGGKMEPYGVERCRADMHDAGIVSARVRMFYDASKPRPLKWDGSLFTTETLVV